jgi:hypothetical protein
MDKTPLDLIEEMAADSRYDKGDLVQIMREGYADDDFEEAIINLYNATEDTQLVRIGNTDRLVDMVKE